MKVLLVGINSKFIHSNLAVRYLKAYTKDLNCECKIREFSINDRKEKILEEIIFEKADVVAFSTYIWNIEYVEDLSKLIKLVEPNTKILFGGPEVTYDSLEFLQNNVGEYVISGEGEETFREFIQTKIYCIENKLSEEDEFEKLCKVKGLYSKFNGKVEFGGERPLMDMNKLIFPYEDMEEFKNKIVYYEASRGCPFNCKYCLSSTIHGVRFLNIDRVKRELKFFIDKGVKLIKFVDRTFNCNSKFSIEIWKFLIEVGGKTTFHFEISADILKKEEIELLKTAPKGMFQFEVGVQTTNNDVLRNINRFVNFEDIKEKVEELISISNIKQHLDLIAGLPGEDLESFKKSFNDVHSVNPEEIQLGFLKLLKGSSMKEETEKWGMVYSPYPPYEILKTDKVSYYEIITLKKVEEMVDKYYNSGKFKTILQYLVPKFKNPFDFYEALAMHFEKLGYFKRSLASTDYYGLFLDFNEKVVKTDAEVLKEIVKFDYLSFNKKQWVPDFLYRDVDKELDRKLKKFVIENMRVSKNIHIEKFSINIFKYIYTNEVEKGSFFIMFDEGFNEIKDITEKYNKI